MGNPRSDGLESTPDDGLKNRQRRTENADRYEMDGPALHERGQREG
jgi:hypothetical protein